MVYSGKPSSGCSRCKERRKKCDETKPTCVNCQKLGRPCPGYPDQLDLIFKNETERVTSKAKGLNQRRRSVKNRGSKQTSSGSPSSDGQDTPDDNALTLFVSDGKDGLDFVPKTENLGVVWLDDGDPVADTIFYPSIEVQATTFFFENFVISSEKEGSGGFLDVLIPMYQATAPNSPLAKSTEAIAVRTAANFPGGKQLLPHADLLYGRALQAVQQAIHDPLQASSDEILLSILMFSLFESVTTSDTDNWSKHIRGAVSIVKSRGMSQFNNPQSLHLFRATRTQMLADALSRCEAVDKFPGPYGWLSDRKSGDMNCLIEYSIRLPNILARAKELLVLEQALDSIDKVNDLLHEAYSLQGELFDWELNMPSHFGYKSVYHPAPKSVSEAEVLRSKVWQPGLVHVYQDVQIASMRNNNRVSQLLCSSVVIDALKWLDPEHYMGDRRYKAVAYKVQYLVDDIAASVPFHLGYRDPGEGPTPEKGPRSRNGIDSTGAYFLIWPLVISTSIPEVPPLQRKWLRAKLNLIARRFGLGQEDIIRVRPGGMWTGEVSRPVKQEVRDKKW